MQKEELGSNQNNNKDRAERREANAAMIHGTWEMFVQPALKSLQ